MNLQTPAHLTIIAQALDCYRQKELKVLAELDPSSEDYSQKEDFLLLIDKAMSEVERGYEEMRKEDSDMMPFQELLREGA